MENDLVIIAKKEDAQKSIYGSLSTVGLFTAFLVLDIIFYLRDKAPWELVLLIISAVLEFFAVVGFLFAWSNFNYARKVINTPLVTFDKNSNNFVVTDCIFHKNLEIPRDDVIDVKISDKGESYIWYNKESKKTSTFIGYSNKGSEDLINNEIQKYKNLHNLEV